MQPDPNHRRVPTARSRHRTWQSGGARFALLPLALGLVPAGLLSACTLAVPALTAESPPLRLSARGATQAGAVQTSTSAPVAGMARLFPITLAHAEQGDVDAMVRLARMHETGTAEVAQDRTEMLHWLALASAMGSGPASYRLYLHYEEQPDGRARALRFKDLAQRQGYFGPVSTHSSR
jgi:TPR repeat protein